MEHNAAGQKCIYRHVHGTTIKKVTVLTLPLIFIERNNNSNNTTMLKNDFFNITSNNNNTSNYICMAFNDSESL